MRILLARAAGALAASGCSGCKKDEPGAGEADPALRMPSAGPDDEPPPRAKRDDTPVPGGSDEEEINKTSPDRVAREWLRAARSDDIIKLARMSPALSDPNTGATMDDDQLRAYYGRLLTGTQNWTAEKPEKITKDRLAKFLTRNKVAADLRKAVEGAGYAVAAEPPPEPSVVLLTFWPDRDGVPNVTSAVEIHYKGPPP